MLTVTSVSKKYKRRQVLQNINFQVAPGECVGLFGANGAGKSTLLSILAGALSPDEGSVTFTDQEVIGYVPQENPLIPELTVKDNLKLWYGKEIPALVEEFGLTPHLKDPVRILSGGMKKRLSIIIAMKNQPKILLLDEPGAALDLPCKHMIRKYLINFCKHGGSVILVSHDEMELDICNRLFLLKNASLSPVEPGTALEDLL